MTTRHFAKPALLRGCAITALLAGASFTAHSAQAQGFQATPTFDPAAVIITDTAGKTEVRVLGNNAVIDWFPDPGAIFLPEDNTGVFLGTSGFSVLNRILPGQVLTAARFDGLVQSFVTDANGGIIGPGGFVAFSSPTGIIVGSTGRFEVPQLMLTTQAVDLNSFTAFANGTGPLLLSGSQNSVQIEAGASLIGTPEDSFLIVASPQITMAGAAYFNGSIVYAASTAVEMTHSSGLFNITITGGTSGGAQNVAIDHSGSSGGPSSTGGGDDHVIYGVTDASSDVLAVSTLFSGNLGFDPAVAAGVVNGDIILSAGYNVTGRTVDGDDNRQGTNSYFDGRAFGGEDSIFLSGINATSNLLAISGGTTALNVAGSTANFDGDLTLVGRQEARVRTDDAGAITVGGDMFVSARNFGLITQSEENINAVGGLASIIAGSGSNIDVTGQTRVAADAVAGVRISTESVIGTGTAGQAEVLALGGTITLAGGATITANAQSDQTGTFPSHGAQTGGLVNFFADEGGSLIVGSLLSLDASAAADGIASPAGGPADATGGTITLGTGSAGGTIQVASGIRATANAYAGGSTFTSGPGTTGQGGSIFLNVLGGGDFQVLAGKGRETLRIEAFGLGGDVTGGGDGGTGIGGTISWTVDASNLSVAGTATISALGIGGSGINGGDGIDNSVSFDVINGSTAQFGNLFLSSSGTGGNAIDGIAGSGFGGNASLTVVDSTLNVGLLDLSSSGTSGLGLIGGLGLGGDATAILDGGTLTANIFGITSFGQGQKGIGNLEGGSGQGGDAVLLLRNGSSLTSLSPFGGTAVGSYGDGGSTVDANAGDGSAGFALFDADSGSTANLSDLQVYSLGFGGRSINGAAGDSFAGTALLNLNGNASVDISGLLYMGAAAFSLDGTIGGSATAGDSNLSVASGTSLSAGSALLEMAALGGNGTAGAGGDAIGGAFTVDLQGTFSVATSANFDATGTGGSGTGGDGGSGTGGTIQFSNNGGFFDAGAATITLDASGTGGDALTAGFSGGNGIGGSANIATQAGALTEVGSLQIIANGFGGNSVDLLGGLGQGGQASFIVSNSATSLISTSGVSLIADGTGGNSTAGTGGDGAGGAVTASVQDIADVSAGGGLYLSAQAVGQDSPGGTGGAASGGAATIDINGGSMALAGGIDIDTDANAGSGVTGGDATGGSVLVQAQFGSLSADGLPNPGSRWNAFGIAGDGTTGNGGAGTAGSVVLIANGANVSIGQLLTVTLSGIGGDGASGGLGQGTSVSMDVINGSTVQFGGLNGFQTAGLGGNGSTGVGGDGLGGDVSIAIVDSALDTGSTTSLAASGNGGSGANGGLGQGGNVSLMIDNGILISDFLFGFATANGGDANAAGAGGIGQGGTISLSLTNGSTLDIDAVANSQVGFFTTGSGGESLDGTGGAGAGGDVSFSADAGSAATLGRLAMGSSGFSGFSTNGASGVATSGIVSASITGDATLDIINLFILNASATARPGATGGTAAGGDASLFIGSGGQVSVGQMQMFADGQGGVGTAGNGGDGTGGSVLLELQGGTFTAGNVTTLIEARGTGGDATGGDGGSGTGGDVIFINDGGLYDSPNAALLFRPFGIGGDALASGGAGGSGLGGTVDFSTLAGGLSEFTFLQIVTNGLGGNSLDTLGGLGQGGSANLTVSGSATSVITNQFLALSASGRGGHVTSGTGIGGDGVGGFATATVQDLAELNVSSSFANFTASGTGRDGDIGGAAIGGLTSMLVDSATFNGPSLTLESSARAGDGTTAGGTAQGGSALLDANAANLSLTGRISLNLNTTGGSGINGGNAAGGSGLVQLVSSTTDIGGNLDIVVAVRSGFDPSGTGAGGDASGGDATLRIEGGTFNALNAFGTIDADAIAGGSQGAGIGGDAFGGTSVVEITGGAVVDLGLGLSIVAPAVSGGSSGGDGGAAFGGINQFTVDGGSDVTVGSLTFETAVTGNSGATGGDVTGGTNSLAITSSIFNSTRLTMFGGAVANGDTATITGGNAEITLADGALASFGDTYLEAYAEAFGTSATTSAGSISVDILAIGSPSFATFGATEFFNDALGGITNDVGRFVVIAADGGLDFTSLLISNLGDVDNPDGSAIIANSGAITFADFLTANNSGDLLLSYGNGGTIIGGSAPDDLTATFDITSSGTILLNGDDGAVRSIAALDSTYTSSDIAVGTNTAFGGGSVTLISSNTSAQAVLGGSAAGTGYTLLQAEADAIRADTLSIQLPDVVGADIDGVVNDLAFVGSAGSGFSRIDLLVDGSIDIIGALALTSAGSGDVLAISAAQQVQITLPTGSISLDNSGAPSGTLQINASRIVAADAALIAEIAADPTSQSVADALLDDGGATTASNFIFADRIELIASELVLTQNTGANGVYGGITVGSGGLVITQPQGAQGLLQVIAFGLRDIGGVQTTNDDWFALVEFATDRAATYTSEATFNNCNIVAGCPVPPEEPIDPEVPNHTVIEHPLDFPEIGDEDGTIDFQFGFDFPRLLDSALISEDALIDEPVTSGGDSAVHALVGASTGENEDGED